MHLLIIVICLITTLSSSLAQTPGQWEKNVVCTGCGSPAGMGFSDNTTGAIVLNTLRLGGFPPPNQIKTYATTDRGQTWTLNIDTVMQRIRLESRLAMQGQTIGVLNNEGGTLVSNDLGESYNTSVGDFALEHDVFVPSPSAIF